MNVLIAPDKFKGSLKAAQVACIIADRFASLQRNVHLQVQAMSDGGDGALEIIKEIEDVEGISVLVENPLFKTVRARYYRNATDAFVELAAASGLTLLDKSQQNCMYTSTYGTGQLIAHAIKDGIKNIHLFAGGSATNDAALGIANALGVRFYDKQRKSLSAPTGAQLADVYHIERHDQLDREIHFQVICDVTNPFFGRNGAACIYAPQKGANSKEVALLDNGLRHIHKVFVQSGYIDVAHIAGAGAAGGVGGGMCALFNASLVKGIDWFVQLLQLEDKIKKSDIVITGEGQLDEQSLQGKVVGGIAALCRKYDKQLIIVCGTNRLERNISAQYGIKEVLSIMDIAPTLEEAISKAPCFLKRLLGRKVSTSMDKFDAWNSNE